jgi:hypothetical protein
MMTPLRISELLAPPKCLKRAIASWTAVTSRRSHRFGLRTAPASIFQTRAHCPSQSGDSSDSVAAVQKLAPDSQNHHFGMHR